MSTSTLAAGPATESASNPTPRETFFFPFLMWLLSRAVILGAFFIIGPGQPVIPPGESFTPGWDVFARWDSNWYRIIVEKGYDYAPDGQQHSIAFFPLFPLLVKAVVSLGVPFNVAGTLLNNLAFLGALILLYRWMTQRFGIAVARWSTAVLAWCPYSLFSTIIYTEGVFLLLTTAALWAFDRQRYGLAMIAGALSTATRITAAPLVPAMLYVAWRERRLPMAYLAGLVASMGLILFMGYCAVRFGEPLAFVKVQSGWRERLGFDWMGWLSIFSFGYFGQPPWNGLIKALMLFGGGFLFWKYRKELPPIALVYGVGAFLLIFLSGSLTSVERYAYGVVTLSMAFGMLLARHWRWGWAVMLYFGVTLGSQAIRIAQKLWVA